MRPQRWQVGRSDDSKGRGKGDGIDAGFLPAAVPSFGSRRWERSGRCVSPQQLRPHRLPPLPSPLLRHHFVSQPPLPIHNAFPPSRFPPALHSPPSRRYGTPPNGTPQAAKPPRQKRQSHGFSISPPSTQPLEENIYFPSVDVTTAPKITMMVALMMMRMLFMKVFRHVKNYQPSQRRHHERQFHPPAARREDRSSMTSSKRDASGGQR